MARQLFAAKPLTALIGVLALLGSVAIAADEATPTPTPRPTGGQSLSDAAKDKKLKGDTADTSGGSIVITNENLSDYASKGGLTTAKPGTNPESRGVHAGSNVRIIDSETSEKHKRKAFWQQKYMQQLERIDAIKRQIEELDLEIPALWNEFYARDDPMYRDGVIKPRLDRSLERRETLAALLLEEEPKLAQIKEQARKDGGEPGWWREIKEPTPMPKNPSTGPGDAIRASDRESTEPPK
ncbi:MAG: hypothetical protein OQK55_03790 [Thermoanaerobaculales bacterium]|nr:hypothetical protein [Thermoanaerobaculales bacterium]